MTWEQLLKLELLKSEFRIFQGKPRPEPVYSGRYEFDGVLHSASVERNKVILVGKTVNPNKFNSSLPPFVKFTLDPKNGSPFLMARYSIAFVVGVGENESFGVITEVNRTLF